MINNNFIYVGTQSRLLNNILCEVCKGVIILINTVTFLRPFYIYIRDEGKYIYIYYLHCCDNIMPEENNYSAKVCLLNDQITQKTLQIFNINFKV
jgi:hypothetical protein